MLSSYRDWVTRVTDILVLRNILPAFIITFLLIGACSDLSEYDSEQVRSTMNDSLITTSESWDVEMILMEQGRARILIEGSYAISYQARGRQETHIKGPVYLQLFDSTGSVETEAWSKRAIYLESQNEFELFDSVRVLTNKERELYTEYLVWSQERDRITSPRFVTIITPSDSISGRGFDGLTDLSEYTIEEPRGRLLVD
jgi:LPS export ABC transporter protein LptC